MAYHPLGIRLDGFAVALEVVSGEVHNQQVRMMPQHVVPHPTGKLVTAPGRYCLSYHVRVVGEGLVPHTDMGSFNSYIHAMRNGQPGGNLGQRPSMLTATGDRWIRRDQVIEVPDGGTPTMISLQLHQATGTVLVDDVSLLRCDE